MTPLYDRDGWIWQDGQRLAWRDAKVHVFTHTLHYGMGCFEGVRAYAGAQGSQLFRVAEHTRRLVESAHALDIPLPFSEAELIDAQRESLTKWVKQRLFKAHRVSGRGRPRAACPRLTTHVMIAAWDLGPYLSLMQRPTGCAP